MRPARALGLLIALVATLPVQAREFTSSDVYPLDFPTVQAVAHVDKVMRQRSGGTLGISTLGNDDRDSENYTVGQVRNGTLDMARVNLAVLNALVPSTAVPALPYLFKSKEHARRTLDGPIGEEILADLEAQGMIGLCFYDGGPRNFYTSKPVRTPGDLKGLKIRVQPGDMGAELLRALGVEPVAVPTDRVYLTLQSGLVDGSEQSWPAYVASRHYNVARYFNMTEHSMSPAVLIFSKRVWDTLSAQDQTIIRAAAKDSVEVMRRLWDDYETTGRKTVEAAGAEVIADVDRQAFADILVPLYSTILGEPALRSMIRRIQTDDPLEQSNR